jgi:putative nucleotidyltransferase with HDIG domain
MDVLVTNTRSVGHGDLETRVDVDGLGELQPLGVAFNDMAEALSSSTTRLRDSESRLLRANVATRRAYEDALSSLAAALDTRDNETREHSYRVMEFSLRLARQVHLTDEQLIYVERGALLHDIGKIGIPDSILLKPSPLSDEEWAVMQTHPRIGFAMLASVQFLNAAAEIIYAHHERWDGAGYPRGLAGEQIPVGARLFAVADVFDALTSDRPYRRAVSYEEARAVIEKECGKHFDPAAVEAFLQVPEEEWLALRQDVSVFVAAQRDRVAKRILEFDLQTRRLSVVRGDERNPRFLRVS